MEKHQMKQLYQNIDVPKAELKNVIHSAAVRAGKEGAVRVLTEGMNKPEDRYRINKAAATARPFITFRPHLRLTAPSFPARTAALCITFFNSAFGTSMF